MQRYTARMDNTPNVDMYTFEFSWVFCDLSVNYLDFHNGFIGIWPILWEPQVCRSTSEATLKKVCPNTTKIHDAFIINQG